MDRQDKIKGTIYGQAIGDALGLGTEFMDEKEMARVYPNGLKHYADIFQDQHRRRWQCGEWTDDTDMMLCIAQAIVEDRQVDVSHIAKNFKAWASGTPRGVGRHTYTVLMFGDYVERPFDVSKCVWEMNGKRPATNGGVMRTSVVGLLPSGVEQAAADICRLTHYDPRCVGSCVIVSEIIHRLICQSSEMTFQQVVALGNRYDARIGEYMSLHQGTDIAQLGLSESKSMGYTLKTLSAALWAYWNASSFEEGLLRVVNSGGDADTNAAVACAILGAKFGYSSIPQEYIDGLLHKELLDSVVTGMAGLS